MVFASLALLLSLQNVRHEFVYRSDRDLKKVAVAGTFNNWNKDASPMTLEADGRTWRKAMDLPVGKHYYKFVLDGEQWITDPKGLRDEDDGNGNMNTVLILYPASYKTPAQVGDGKVTRDAILHLQRSPDLNLDKGRLSLTLTVRPGDIQRVAVLTGGGTIPMARLSADEITETYRASLPFTAGQPFAYAFEITDGNARWHFGPKGLTGADPSNRYVLEPGKFKPFVVPGWVEASVFYQIFPDRFENGDPSNDPKDVQPWSAEPTYWNRFGGDVAGIRKRMRHLESLGIDAVYFNPVMKAPSNHRYDPVDFYQIDPEFGTNADFAALTRELKGAGIRTVLDQIFDHVGTTFAPFADLLENQQNSKYKDWFFVKSYPVEVKQNPPYEAWWGAESMPKINVRNPEAYEYLMKSVDFWHGQLPLAGWRLDVANEVPDFFWQDFRRRVKKIDPNAWILGEVWGDARHWLTGDMWDASMNYPFRDAVVKFVAEGKTKPSQFMDQLMTVYGWYAPQVSRNQLNLLSSHDTPRFLTLAGGDRRLAKLGAAVQFTWPGAPSIYYGEEIGMEGGADPQNRRAMRWDLATDANDLLTVYRKLIAARKRNRVLQNGDPVVLLADDAKNVAAFGRVEGPDYAVVVLNRSQAEQTVLVPLEAIPGAGKKSLNDALEGGQVEATGGTLRVTVPPLGFRVLVGRRTDVSLPTKSIPIPVPTKDPGKDIKDGLTMRLSHPTPKEPS